LLKQNQRKIFLVIDSDVNDPTHGKKEFQDDTLRQKYGLTEEYVVKLGNREFEDLFTDEVWASTFNSDGNGLRKVADGSEWAIEEITAIRSEPKFSKALQELMVQYCDRCVSKPELGIMVAREAINLDIVPNELTGLMRRIASASGARIQ
jgi:hypothetical protein